MLKTVRILLPLQKLFPLTYLIPEDIANLSIGELVIVPFKSYEITGIVWDFEEPIKFLKLKYIKARFSPTITLSSNLRELIVKAANYYLADLGSIAKLVLPVEVYAKNFKTLADHVATTFALSCLSTNQEKILARIEEDKKPTVLKGVTGSGKTEIYFNLVAKHLLKGEQCLIMLPEISLTTQIVKRFFTQFGFTPTIWNSSITLSQKKIALRGILTGVVKMVIGARSSLFLPYDNLGLIVVDEEHDASYKQEENILYNARDMAVLRANIFKTKILLCSATPSIETIQNVNIAKYSLIELKERYKDSALPLVRIIDMKLEKLKAGKWISKILIAAIEKNLLNNEQVLLFLNRRGYSPLLLCQCCGYRFMCKNCTSWLVLHKAQKTLECHHCGWSTSVPTICPECLTTDKILPCGPGVERIAEEVKAIFPDAKVSIISKDEISKKGEAETILHQMENNEINILIGTQIITKGYHFPNLTLVGVIDGDLGSNEVDLKASEKNFQLLYQVGGRAGREKKQGYLFLQTYQPENIIFDTLKNHDYSAFIEYELLHRKNQQMPPFAKLALIRFSGKNKDKLFDVAQNFAINSPTAPVKILGPARALLTKIAGRYKYTILLITDKKFPIQSYLLEWMSNVKIPSSIKIKVNIDPMSFN